MQSTTRLNISPLPFLIAGQELRIGSSIGIAVFPEHGDDVNTLLKNSDIAMYNVKKRDVIIIVSLIWG